MSRYFQQLLASSGPVLPVAAALPAFTPSSISPPVGDLVEIIEEQVAPSAPPAPLAPPMPTSLREAAPEAPVVTPYHERKLTPPAPAHTEPGTVEIRTETVALSPATASTSARPPGPPSSATLPVSAAPPPAVTEVSLSAPAVPSRAATPVPSRDELIQHVFRWVGENPSNLVPPALASSSPGPAPAATPRVVPDPAVATLPPLNVSAPSPLHAPIAPPPPRERTSSPAPAAAVAVVQESSVEISIGTLQIQVEAPPAPKPARRTTAPHAPAPGLPASPAARPAIDLNRLRRGFYL